MRVAAGLSPMTPAMARQPMAPHALHRELSCTSCHGSHDFDTQFAATDACLDCHVDDHSLAFRNTKHFNEGLSCASCHMPRVELENGRVGVQHNQNDNLRPNEKMIRSVCIDCHGVEFSLKALADPMQKAICYDGAAETDLQTLEWVRTRVKEIAERRRASEEARKKKKKKIINEDDL